MRPKRTEHTDQQEQTIEQLLLFLDAMAGEEVDNSEKRAIALAVGKSFRESKKKRKPY